MKVLQSLEDVYNKKLFRIPDYQRGYAWGIKQLTDFWDDLISLGGNRNHYTGVISIKEVPESVWKLWRDEKWLIENRRFTPYYVVDGQQRLTTTSIFLQCLVEQIKSHPSNKELNDDSIYLGSYTLKEIKEKFIVVSQPPEFIINTYKFGYEADNPSFEFLRFKIYNEPSSGSVNETFYTLNLENAKQFFKTNINEIVKAKGEKILQDLYEKLSQKFLFNLYEINDDFDVFVAFETMNNRGKILSDLELLKNRLIYLTTLYGEGEVKENDKIAIRDNINDAWREIYFQLGRNKHFPLNDDDFLKAHWVMYFKYSRKKGDDYIRFLLDEEFSPKKVLEKVQVHDSALQRIEEIKDAEADDEELNDKDAFFEPTHFAKLPIKDIHKYVLSLRASAKHWYNSFNPEHNSELTTEESILLDRLNRIGIAYFRPLVLASFVQTNIGSEERIKLLTAIERFIFLEFRVSRAMSTYRSSVYYGAARDLYYENQSVSGIIASLEEDSKGLFNRDGSFKSSYFKDYIDRKFSTGGSGFYGWNALRYFLYEYEEALMRDRNIPKIAWKNFVKSEKDRVSIEHILPQTPSEEDWGSAFSALTEDEIMYLTGSLGNLLPLSSSINSSLQNDSFSLKKSVKTDDEGNVIRNGYANGSYSEREVAVIPDWTPEEIKMRGLKMLKFMERRWAIRFSNETEMLELLHLNELNTALNNTSYLEGFENLLGINGENQNPNN
jgi:hypothetical protein